MRDDAVEVHLEALNTHTWLDYFTHDRSSLDRLVFSHLANLKQATIQKDVDQ